MSNSLLCRLRPGNMCLLDRRDSPTQDYSLPLPRPLHRTTQGWEGGKEKLLSLSDKTFLALSQDMFLSPPYLIDPTRPLPNSTSLVGDQLNKWDTNKLLTRILVMRFFTVYSHNNPDHVCKCANVL